MVFLGLGALHEAVGLLGSSCFPCFACVALIVLSYNSRCCFFPWIVVGATGCFSVSSRLGAGYVGMGRL